nr:PREDICTED: uncharacterized protein LOC108953548 [Musa acuminata subsp. malaccensis]
MPSRCTAASRAPTGSLEKRGFLLCQEDRAISCRDGDVAIHSATAVTKKHCRFLLTVVRVSAVPIPSSQAVEAEAVDSLHGSIIKDSSSVYGHHGGGDEQHLVAADQDAAGVAFCPTRFRLGFLRRSGDCPRAAVTGGRGSP